MMFVYYNVRNNVLYERLITFIVYLDHRIFPLYHDNLAASIREKGLGEAWTPERTLEYLMVGGLLPEAVWFVHSLGDWKAAFLMSVALMEHERSTPGLYERCELVQVEESNLFLLRDANNCI